MWMDIAFQESSVFLIGAEISIFGPEGNLWNSILFDSHLFHIWGSLQPAPLCVHLRWCKSTSLNIRSLKKQMLPSARILFKRATKPVFLGHHTVSTSRGRSCLHPFWALQQCEALLTKNICGTLPQLLGWLWSNSPLGEIEISERLSSRVLELDCLIDLRHSLYYLHIRCGGVGSPGDLGRSYPRCQGLMHAKNESSVGTLQ